MMDNKHWEYEDTDMILFWNGIFSNWHPAGFVIEGVEYNCVEQYMMAEKARFFNDTEIEQKIMNATFPGEQKSLGRKVRKFDADAWMAVCREKVLPGIIAKFKSHPSLKNLLLQTGDKIIAEASPVDKIWGIGLAPDDTKAQDQANWDGLNILGELTMEARRQLKENA